MFPFQLSELMGAVERDDLKRLQQLLSTARDKQSISQLAKCLHMASMWGHQDCVDALIEAGAMTNVHDVNGNTPLIVAVRQDHVSIVKTLIEAKCNVNKATYLAHATPLHYAVSNGSLDCARLLIGAGAEIEAQTSSGRTPLMLACRSGHEQAVDLLLKAGARVDRTDNDRAVALNFAAEENNIDCVRHLLSAGANTSLLTKYGDNALGLAARKGNLEIMDLLLNHPGGPSPSWRRSNMNPLHWASEGGHLASVQLLLDRKSFDVNLGTRLPYSRGDFLANKGVVPLMLASRGGYCSIVELLLSHQAEVDKMDNDGMTALLYAIKGDHWRCVEALLSAGACVNGLPVTPNGLPVSPLLVAVSNRSLAALRVLLRANCATNQLGLLRADGDPILPIMLVAQQQEDVQHILQLFAIAECQNPDFVQRSCCLMEASCCDVDLLRDILSHMTTSSAPSLALLCRHVIRCHMGDGVFHRVPLLPIPSSLKRFLLLEELEEEI